MIIPIVLAVILCLITICVYRYRKKRAQEISATGKRVYLVIKRLNKHFCFVVAFNLVLSNQNESSQSPQANIFVMEEQPPSYEILNEKNQNKNSITSNTYTSSSVHTVGTNVN